MKQVLAELLVHIIAMVTPELRKTICKLLKDFVSHAAKSKNPWDDILAKVLMYLFDCTEGE